MRVFIVGATGVLGRSLLPMLLEEGHVVRALVRSRSRSHPLDSRVDVVEGDLLDPHHLNGRLPSLLIGYDAAIHIATAIPRDPTAPGAWEPLARLRTEGTHRLLDAALRAGISRYVQQSIVMAYVDGGDSPLDEATPLDTSPERAAICAPVIAMEAMVREISPRRLGWAILRGGLFVGSGTGQEEDVDRLRRGTQTVPCDGSSYVSLIHVGDMARAVVCALKRAPGGSVFNIVDEPIRLGPYLDRLATIAGAPMPLREGGACPPSFRCSNDAACSVLQWEPRTGIWPEASPNGSR